MCGDRASARDVLAYLDWWDYMLWCEAHRSDPTVDWQADLSWDQIAAAVGVEAPRLAPGDLPMDHDLAVGLYWPGLPPARERQLTAVREAERALGIGDDL